MIEVRVMEQVPEETWRSLVDRCQGNPLHLPQVHFGYFSKRDLRYLLFCRAGTEIACAPAFLRSAGKSLFRGRTWALELPTPPAASKPSPEERRGIYESLIRYCRDLGLRRLAIGHAWGDCFRDLALLSDHVTHSVTEFVLDLTLPLETLLGKMHKVHRKNMRQAEAHGLTCRVETSLSALLQLRSIQLAAAERSRARGQGFSVEAPGYFRGVHERVYAQGLGEVIMAFSDGECVAAIAYLSTGTKGITVRSGCTPQGYDTNAMFLLHARLMERAKEKELHEINLGGVPAEAENPGHPAHGLHNFKKGFGGQMFLRTAVSMDLRRISL